MKTTQTVIVSLLFLSLAACGGVEVQKEVVTNVRTQVVAIPAPLLEKCATSTPPNKKLYKDTDEQGRIELLVIYSMDLLKDIAKCDNKITQIRELQDKQNAIYTKPSEKH
jgi:hypothetical protein